MLLSRGWALLTYSTLWASVALPGCVIPVVEPEDNVAGFVAWFANYPRFPYVERPIGVDVKVRIAGSDNMGLAGTVSLCLQANKEIKPYGLNSIDCQDISLVPGETKSTSFTFIAPNPGKYELRLLNATLEMDIKSMPRIGERINGSLIDLQLISAHQTDKPWESTPNMFYWAWEYRAWFRNGSVPLKVTVPSGGGGQRPLLWNGTETHAIIEGFRPTSNEPMGASVIVPNPDAKRDVTGTSVDSGLFYWCCGEANRTSYP